MPTVHVCVCVGVSVCVSGGVRVYVCECVVNFKMYLHSRSLVLFHFCCLLSGAHIINSVHGQREAWAEGEAGKAVRVAYVGAELA